VAACDPATSARSGEPGGQVRPPGRILSLAPSITETLFAVGAGAQIVGVDAYSDYPAAARSLPRLGALLDPDLEAMLRLRPDLAILLPSQAETARALDAAGVSTLTVPHETLADVGRAVLAIGRRTGHAREAEALADSLHRELLDIRSSAADSGRRLRVLFVVAREEGQLASFTAAGPRTYLDELIGLAGGDNALRDSPTRYPQISAETALRLAPDLILEWTPSERPGDSREERQADNRRIAEWRTLIARPDAESPAVQVLHDDLWLRPGPRVVDALDLLRSLLERPARVSRASG
jgi:iron complex transport system substrate-binding protein